MGVAVSLHGSHPEPLMSALGQKQTSAHVGGMSALPPIADIDQSGRDVRFVPKADILTSWNFTLSQPSFAHAFKEFSHRPRRIRNVPFDPSDGMSRLQFLKFRQCRAGLIYLSRLR